MKTEAERRRDRRIAALAVPALGALAIEPLYVLVDTAIVGRLGASPLGGLALASTVLNAVLWVCNFLSYGTTARVTREREHGQCSACYQLTRHILQFLPVNNDLYTRDLVRDR